MKICLDIRFKTESGASTYIRNILPLLLNHKDAGEYLIISNGQINFRENKSCQIIELPQTSPYKQFLWTQMNLPTLLNNYNIDIYHSLKHIPPFSLDVKTIFTLGSVGFYAGDYPLSFKETIYWKFIRKRILKKTDKIIVKSNHNKEILVKLGKISKNKVEIINNGIDEDFKPIEKTKAMDFVEKEHNLRRPFILCIGNVVPVKNHMVVVKACEKLWEGNHLPYDLVLIGGTHHIYAKKLKVYTAESKYWDRFHILGFLNRSQLPYFYNTALCLVHPSLHEGFPMATLEAMACGLPVICTLRGGLKEACGDAALYLNDPDNADGLAILLKKLVADQNLRANLHNKGIQRGKLFSWEEAARKTVSIYKNILDIPNVA